MAAKFKKGDRVEVGSPPEKGEVLDVSPDGKTFAIKFDMVVAGQNIIMTGFTENDIEAET